MSCNHSSKPTFFDSEERMKDLIRPIVTPLVDTFTQWIYDAWGRFEVKYILFAPPVQKWTVFTLAVPFALLSALLTIIALIVGFCMAHTVVPLAAVHYVCRRISGHFLLHLFECFIMCILTHAIFVYFGIEHALEALIK